MKREHDIDLPESIAEIILTAYFSNRSLSAHVVEEVQLWLVKNSEREDVVKALEKIWDECTEPGDISSFGKYISLQKVRSKLAEAEKSKREN